MADPTSPLRTYLPPQPGDRRLRLRPEDAPACDPELPRRAYQYRTGHQFLKPADFRSYNITVWRLQNRSGAVEYITRQNTTIGELARKFGPAPDKSSQVGFHSEMLVAQEVYRRPDVRRLETVVTQVFTERFPCSECQSLLSNYPQFRHAPYYYYLSNCDRAWQRKQTSGDWGLFLLKQYG